MSSILFRFPNGKMWCCITVALFLIQSGRQALGSPVVGGHDVGDSGKYPYLVLLEFSEEITEPSGTEYVHYTCGGSLLTRDLVLTAAHCLDDFLTEPQSSVAGGILDRRFKGNGQKTRMKDYVMHENYLSTTGREFQQNDIALVWLEREFQLGPHVQLATLASRPVVLYGKEALVAGWGCTEDGFSSERLKEGTLNVISGVSCSITHQATDILPTMLCALSKGKSTIPCLGDSGGPLLMNGLVVGISSFGGLRKVLRTDGELVDTCDPKIPAVFTKVSSYKSWIHQNRQLGPPLERRSREKTHSDLSQQTRDREKSPTPTIDSKRETNLKPQLVPCKKNEQKKNCAIL